MKQFIVILLALMYLATSTGATVHLHYCMDELVEQNFFKSSKEECGNCGMKKSQQKKGCCKDEHKQIKIESKHFVSEFAFKAAQDISIVLPVFFPQLPEPHFTSISESHPVSHAPPDDDGGMPIYKRIRVFLI